MPKVKNSTSKKSTAPKAKKSTPKKEVVDTPPVETPPPVVSTPVETTTEVNNTSNNVKVAPNLLDYGAEFAAMEEQLKSAMAAVKVALNPFDL